MLLLLASCLVNQTVVFGMAWHGQCDSSLSCAVCFVSFITGLFCFGIHNSYGIMHMNIKRQFHAKNIESGKSLFLLFSVWQVKQQVNKVQFRNDVRKS